MESFFDQLHEASQLFGEPLDGVREIFEKLIQLERQMLETMVQQEKKENDQKTLLASRFQRELLG